MIRNIVIAVVVVGLLAWLGFGLPDTGGEEPVVVYCAHDAVFSEAILDRFERETGIPVEVKFDTEATKSLGLVELLIREKDNPRADVFWNNQLMGTLDLMDAGVLEPYKGAGYERIPAAYRDPGGHWTGFGARLRVWIINTDEHEVSQGAIERTLSSEDLSNVTVAKPLFGTTRTHYTVLWDVMGAAGLKAWHADLRERGLIEAQSNGMTKNLVSSGTCAIGWTDTDDYYVAKDAGAPVAMLPAQVADGQVVCIPNTVALIRGTDQREKAGRLIDFLLSESVELALANSRSRQIPLGEVDEAKLPDEVRELQQWVGEGYDLTELDAARTACLSWLKSEYVKE